MATVNDPNHAALQKSVTDWFEENDFYFVTAAYHETVNAKCPDVFCGEEFKVPILSDEIKKHLAFKCWNTTALYLRGRSDNFVMQKSDPYDCYEIEFKTSGKNMALELLPLVHHMAVAPLGVDCLYVYKDYEGTERGFWCSDIPEAACIFVPMNKKWTDAGIQFFESMAKQFFSSVKIIHLDSAKGSGDVFVKFDWEIVKELPEWKTLVQARIKLG